MELHLISASVVVGEPADCDVVFHLEGRQDDLPNVSEICPWAGNSISPLRDRLMIDWLFSTPGALRRLRSMITQINSPIEGAVKQSTCTSSEGPGMPTASPAQAVRRIVRVGVVCDTGAQMSPCFVEKLYEHYTSASKSPPRNGLEVRKYHWDAFRGSWGRNRNFVWQHRILPIRHKKGDVGGISRDRLWFDFPAAIGAVLEEEFQKNPHSRDFKCGDETFSFETGLMYDRNSGNTFRIRCVTSSTSQIPGPTVNCWFLSGHSYLETAKTYRSAGILPYSVHPRTGEAVFLVGKITYGSRDWCDFGGLKNVFEKPRHTAARECYEETFGILGSASSLSAALKDFITNNAFKVVNEDTKYVSHFLRVPYGEYPDRFSEIVKKKKAEGKKVEVKRMSWVSISSVKNAVRMAFLDQLPATVESITCEDGEHTCRHQGPQLLHLRTEFLHTLCIADELGIIGSIQHITKDVHSKDARRVFRMPYVSMPKSFPKTGASKTATCNDPPALQDETVPVVIERTVQVDSESLAGRDPEGRLQTATLVDTASMLEEPTSLNLLAPHAENTPDVTTDSEKLGDLRSRVQASALFHSAPDTSSSQATIACTCSASIDPPVVIDLTSGSESVAVVESGVHAAALPDSAPDTNSSQEFTKSTSFRDVVIEQDAETVTSQIGSCIAANAAGDSSSSLPKEEMPRRRVKHGQKHRDTDKSKKKAGTKHSNGGSRSSATDGPKMKKTVLYYGMGAGTFAYSD